MLKVENSPTALEDMQYIYDYVSSNWDEDTARGVLIIWIKKLSKTAWVLPQEGHLTLRISMRLIEYLVITLRE